MAGYPKIWTTIRHEPWFKKLSIVNRAIWLQLILITKEQKDDGHVTFSSYTHMAAELGCSRDSAAGWVATEVRQGRVILAEKSATLTELILVHYNDSQAVKRYDPKKKACVSIKHISNNHANFANANPEIKNKPGFTRKIVTAPGTNTTTEIWVPNTKP